LTEPSDIATKQGDKNYGLFPIKDLVAAYYDHSLIQIVPAIDQQLYDGVGLAGIQKLYVSDQSPDLHERYIVCAEGTLAVIYDPCPVIVAFT
jgi:hypothetical protein